MTSAWRHRLFVYGITIPFAFVLAFPFFWMGVTSLKPEAQVYDPKKTWNFDATLANYGNLFHHTEYLRWLRNSCFVGLLVVLVTLAVALPAGYALARLSGRVGRTLGVGIFLTYLVPPTLLFLPLSRVIAQYFHLSDRLWALVLVYPSFTIPFAIWLLMGFFKTIPQELEDAALIDGCSRLGAFVRIVLPVSIPGMGARSAHSRPSTPARSPASYSARSSSGSPPGGRKRKPSSRSSSHSIDSWRAMASIASMAAKWLCAASRAPSSPCRRSIS